MPASIHPATMLVPPLDKAGHRELSDQVFTHSFQVHTDLCRKYPASIYHRVMAARLAARCKRRLEEAIVLLDEALAIDPTRPILHATRAEVHLARGDHPAAVLAAREGLRLEPGNEECQNVLEQAESAIR
jgi:predicted Zn-dependent protease